MSTTPDLLRSMAAYWRYLATQTTYYRTMPADFLPAAVRSDANSGYITPAMADLLFAQVDYWMNDLQPTEPCNPALACLWLAEEAIDAIERGGLQHLPHNANALPAAGSR